MYIDLKIKKNLAKAPRNRSTLVMMLQEEIVFERLLQNILSWRKSS
jgi:hypothetical protein